MVDVIPSRYSNHELKIISKDEKLGYRTRKLAIDIEFLNNFLNLDLCPTFLKYKMPTKRLLTFDAYIISQQVFIQQEVKLKTLEIDKVRAQLSKMKDDLRSVLSFFDWSHIANTFVDSNIETIKGVKKVQECKFAELLGSTVTHDPKEVIYNFSSYELSDTKKALLCKGLNFAISSKNYLWNLSFTN